MLNLKVFCEPGAQWIEKREEDAAYDLVYPGSDVYVPQGGLVKLALGIYTSFSKNFVAQIWDRSSMGCNGLKVLGGVVDSGYRGEWTVILANVGPCAFSISKGMKVAQVMFIPLAQHLSQAKAVLCKEKDELGSSDRGDKGFGSTGASIPMTNANMTNLALPASERKAA
jgi:dUTP pyrophosphatase